MRLDGSDLAVLIPLWRRTDHIDRVHASIRATTPMARVVFVVSQDDQHVNEAMESTSFGDEPGRPTLPFRTALVSVPGGGGEMGDYARKINAGYHATTEPFLFTGADDLIFHDGWYDAARSLMRPLNVTEVIFGAANIGVVGTNDLTNPRTMTGDHSTHSLVARWYADCCAVTDQPGAIYAEVYGHEYCDDELVETARARGAYAHALDAIVEHMHPIGGKAPDDDVYQHGRSATRLSRRRFYNRRRLWQ